MTRVHSDAEGVSVPAAARQEPWSIVNMAGAYGTFRIQPWASRERELLTAQAPNVAQERGRVMRMVIAAPDLLAALEGVQFAGPRHRCVECGGQPVTGHLKGCRVASAIAKAGGDNR